jgi:S1-C subfamily serine protease
MDVALLLLLALGPTGAGFDVTFAPATVATHLSGRAAYVVVGAGADGATLAGAAVAFESALRQSGRAELQPGSSGAPLVDRSGRVVGIVTAGIREANAINFAIRADVALRSLDRLAVLGNLLRVKAPAGVAVFLDGVLAGPGPRLSVSAKPGEHEVMAIIDGRMQRRRFIFPETRTVALP